ncbi:MULTISPECIES: HMA2 domain-containing protein [unclassified Vibrio]|uniref:HMA2 domain-containing protein n=1 Tax=unclassified Vibrio TaxID=2614977 RepID=UPI001E5FB7E7|nr:MULTISPECIES: hypothetical protein [unclassified Vibrio]
MNTYIHKTNQRLRVRSDFIKTHPKTVQNLLSQFEDIDAIHKVTHKKHAGSVAICFDCKELDCESLIEILDSHGWLKSSEKPSFIENAAVSGTKTLAKSLAGIALSRLIGPSVSRAILNFA